MAVDYVLHPFRPLPDLKIDYAAELNAQQHAAVTAPPGPALVIAGAGSGKTRTLTYRTAFLIEQGIPPERILLLTFTNKAAREMMGRVADLVGGEMSALWGGTFHSIGHRILRRHADLLGFQKDFTILDREDAKDHIAACRETLGDLLKAGMFPKADELGDLFSLAVNKELKMEAILGEQSPEWLHLVPAIEKIRVQYTERKKAANSLDFDDLLVLWLRLLRDHQDVRELYQRRFQFILVDEYQDTNRIQGDLIDLLAARHKNVMVVGDDSQSIYSWRGALLQNILQFPQRYPDAKMYRIETNYRSTPEILNVANAAISANVAQFAKELAPCRKPGQKPVRVTCTNGHEEAQFVAQRVLELREEGTPLDKIGVLYRSHFHALDLQMELTRQQIPFSITSGIRFFEQSHIKDVVAHIKFVVNPRDEISFKRIVCLLPGIGKKGAEKLWTAFHASAPPSTRSVAGSTGDSPVPGGDSPHGTGVVADGSNACVGEIESRDLPPGQWPSGTGGSPVLPEKDQTPRLAIWLRGILPCVPKRASVAFDRFVHTIAQLEAAAGKQSAGELIELTLEAGYEDYLKSAYANYRSRKEDLEQLASFSVQFETLDEFLAQLALQTSVEAEAEAAGARNEERLRLTTVHQAKGLEFDVVFIIMLCDGLFPSARSIEAPEGEEEERRLFYVAITRARNELYLSHPSTRQAPGGGVELLQKPSRFLREIPQSLTDEWNLVRDRW